MAAHHPATQRLPADARDGDFVVVAGAIVGALSNIEKLLRDNLLDIEQEPDFDQSWVVVPTQGGAPNIVQIQLPRTLRHVEVTLTVDNPSNREIVTSVLDGSMSLAQALASAPLNITVGQGGGMSAAVIAGASGSRTIRDYLGGSGYLTVLFSNAAANVYQAMVRVRSLDALQARAQRD